MTYTSNIDAPRGRMSVPPGPALRAVIYGLLTGVHWWLWDELDADTLAHAALARSPDDLRALVAAEDADEAHWTPRVTVSDDAIRWEPWGISDYAYRRYIRIGYDGAIEWDTGHGRASSFVASVLVALGADPAGVDIQFSSESQPRAAWTVDGDRIHLDR